MILVKVAPETTRGFIVYDNGQRAHTWVPAGDYAVAPSDLRGYGPCKVLLHLSGKTYHVPAPIADRLPPA